MGFAGITTGLIVGSHFDNSTTDISGNGHTLTPETSYAYSSSVKAVGSHSANLDGIDNALKVDDAADLDGFTAGFSGAIHIRRQGAMGANQRVFNKYATAGDNRSYLFLFTAADKLALHLARTGDGASNWTSTTTNTYTNTSDFIHVMFTWNPGEWPKIYVDNALQAVAETGSGGDRTLVAATASDLYVGKDVTDVQYLKAYMDEWGFWAKVLSAGERAYLAAGGVIEEPAAGNPHYYYAQQQES